MITPFGLIYPFTTVHHFDAGHNRYWAAFLWGSGKAPELYLINQVVHDIT